jgi:hypothetical protein
MVQGIFHVGRSETVLCDVLHVPVWVVRQIPNDINKRHALALGAFMNDTTPVAECQDKRIAIDRKRGLPREQIAATG